MNVRSGQVDDRAVARCDCEVARVGTRDHERSSRGVISFARVSSRVLLGRQAAHCDYGEAKVSHLVQDAVQGRLIRQRA
jgi:hypothetical protein